VKLRSASSSPNLFKRMIDETDRAARPGDVVAVYDKIGAPYGVALYNPKSLISLRLLSRDIDGFDADKFFGEKLDRAIELRRKVLRLDESTDAYRLVYDHGDGMPGLVIDRYADVFVLEFYSFGMFRQAERLERLLEKHFPGSKFVRRASTHTESMEGFRVPPQDPVKTRVTENGVVFEVTPSGGYKTGFFCDQRDNRLAASRFAAGKRVLDVCSYTGGFGLYAAKLGGASEVTCVELDPEASALAKRNANINQVKLKTTVVDCFPYLRQAAANNEKWGLVIADPYKLIATKEGWEEGRQKYIDINKLSMAVVEPGGILVTCSCSGILHWPEFQGLIRTAAGAARRRVQILKKSGAGGDHPIATDYPEGEYLKVLWCRVL
jgi:23S rRNA (cytosine1962-C5)-methyltransferase